MKRPRPRGEDSARPHERGAERLRLDLAFVGTPFRGWQSQAKGTAVQDLIERALRAVGHRGPRPVGCSRTDAGVHARLYAAHVEGVPERACSALLRGLNAELPPEVRIYRASRVPGDFHARHSCLGKTYRYHLCTGPTVPPFLAPFVWAWRGKLDRDALHEGAVRMAGDHDFAAFTTVEGRTKRTQLTVEAVRWEEEGPLLTLVVEGRAFLHRMVRCMAGALVAMGTGRLSAEDLRRALDGNLSGPQIPALPAQGLTLWEVRYAAVAERDEAGGIPKGPIFPL